jgi:hypothetical protein
VESTSLGAADLGVGQRGKGCSPNTLLPAQYRYSRLSPE